MIVTCVAVFVKPEYIEQFIKATAVNHENSIKERGNMRFDVLQGKDDSGRFLLYEAYESDESAGAHKQTDHYKIWRETVEPFMERPREGTHYNVVAPQNKELW